MTLNKLPVIELSENSIFLLALAILTFIFFFTREEPKHAVKKKSICKSLIFLFDYNNGSPLCLIKFHYDEIKELLYIYKNFTKLKYYFYIYLIYNNM